MVNEAPKTIASFARVYCPWGYVRDEREISVNTHDLKSILTEVLTDEVYTLVSILKYLND
jgi:hypothetical protein